MRIKGHHSSAMTAIAVLIILVLVSCQELNDKSRDLANGAKNKAGKLWKKAVDKAFDAGSTTLTTSFEREFGDRDSLHVLEINGLQIDWPAGFRYVFLKYKADKETIINYVNNLPTSENGKIADDQCQRSNNETVESNLKLIEDGHADMAKRLTFFYEIREKKSLEYYECIRSPFTHYLIFDTKNGVVYHHFENSRD